MEILQLRRLKKYINHKNLMELAILIRWDEPHGQSPIEDELKNDNAVEWKALGLLTIDDEMLDRLKNITIAPLMYFTDDVK